ncbi:hypothetical protein [Streptomyces carpinensis]|uniref:Uncharacterized protein n=1 Tax=Streptomyces carpinensis TaxID=66369 RepID=A0ABV1W3R0_9ACTN|nr:hypothetical protein [Streptomyces carpinensis]
MDLAAAVPVLAGPLRPEAMVDEFAVAKEYVSWLTHAKSAVRSEGVATDGPRPC